MWRLLELTDCAALRDIFECAPSGGLTYKLGYEERDAVAIDEVREWPNPQAEPMYIVVFVDALRVEIRDEGVGRYPEFRV
ncbi:hypothetical protein C6P82_28020 [Burkholderia multivorans]|nr:hypothetical protein C6P82_28020 [Burkholderia multivorans]